MKYLANSFSLQMLPQGRVFTTTVEPVTKEWVPTDAVSVIGHADTAAVVSDILGRPVPMNRASVVLGDGDEVFVAQVRGGRLPEGATTLPEGFRLDFVRVRVARPRKVYSVTLMNMWFAGPYVSREEAEKVASELQADEEFDDLYSVEEETNE